MHTCMLMRLGVLMHIQNSGDRAENIRLRGRIFSAKNNRYLYRTSSTVYLIKWQSSFAKRQTKIGKYPENKTFALFPEFHSSSLTFLNFNLTHLFLPSPEILSVDRSTRFFLEDARPFYEVYSLRNYFLESFYTLYLSREILGPVLRFAWKRFHLTNRFQSKLEREQERWKRNTRGIKRREGRPFPLVVERTSLEFSHSDPDANVLRLKTRARRRESLFQRVRHAENIVLEFDGLSSE